MLKTSDGAIKIHFKLGICDIPHLNNILQFMPNSLTIFSLSCFFYLCLSWSFLYIAFLKANFLTYYIHTKKHKTAQYRVNTHIYSVPRSRNKIFSEPRNSFPTLFPQKLATVLTSKVIHYFLKIYF